MTLKFRTEDLDRWGAGLGRNLHPLEVDENFWELLDRVSDLEALPSAPPAITEFEVVGDTFYVHFDDSTTLGPYLLPSTLLNPITWTPNTVVSRMDVFSMNGVLYVVMLDHTTDDEFDPGANNGLGDDYYFAMLTAPGNSLPTGGAAGMILTKSTSADFAVTWSWKLPSGGSAGQYLRKSSLTQDAAAWATILADEVEFEPATDSPLAAGSVADALEQLASGGVIGAENVPYTPPSGSGSSATNVADAIDELRATGGSGRQTMYVAARGATSLLTDGADSGLFETATYKNVVATFDFDPDTSQGVQFEVAMPKSWDRGEVSFRLFWSHETSTFNDVVWRVHAYSFTDGSEFDQNMNNTVSVTATGTTAEALCKSDESDPLEILDIDAGLAPSSDNDMVIIQIWRHAESGSDTLDVDARLHGIMIFYNTTTGTDD